MLWNRKCLVYSFISAQAFIAIPKSQAGHYCHLHWPDTWVESQYPDFLESLKLLDDVTGGAIKLKGFEIHNSQF